MACPVSRRQGSPLPMSDGRPPAGLVGIPRLLQSLVTPTLPASEAKGGTLYSPWVLGDHLTQEDQSGCIGASNRQQGLKPDSCG